MKKSKNSLYTEDWKKKAQKDWDRIKRNLRDQDSEAAAYFLQQSLEKYLKAYLLQQGWQLKKIHVLHTLLDDAVRYNKALEVFYDLCERVSGYYFIERYPGLLEEGLTCKDIETGYSRGTKIY